MAGKGPCGSLRLNSEGQVEKQVPLLTKPFFFSLLVFLSYMYEYFAGMHVCAIYGYLVLLETRRGHYNHSDKSYRWLCVDTWVLRLTLSPLEEKSLLLTSEPSISPAPAFIFNHKKYSFLLRQDFIV